MLTGACVSSIRRYDSQWIEKRLGWLFSKLGQCVCSYFAVMFQAGCLRVPCQMRVTLVAGGYLDGPADPRKGPKKNKIGGIKHSLWFRAGSGIEINKQHPDRLLCPRFVSAGPETVPTVPACPTDRGQQPSPPRGPPRPTDPSCIVDPGPTPRLGMAGEWRM